MADGHGGYRQPSNPAPVSGPGAHSQRTDRGPKQHQITGGSYGDAQAFQQQQSASPLSAPAGAPGSTAPSPVQMPTGLGADTQHPDQPVTAGADAGAGPGMAEAGIAPQQADAELRAKLGPTLPVLMRMADSQYATDAFKEQVRQLIARVTT
jgi:hypothetical protein